MFSLLKHNINFQIIPISIFHIQLRFKMWHWTVYYFHIVNWISVIENLSYYRFLPNLSSSSKTYYYFIILINIKRCQIPQKYMSFIRFFIKIRATYWVSQIKSLSVWVYEWRSINYSLKIIHFLWMEVYSKSNYFNKWINYLWLFVSSINRRDLATLLL